jgi:hypothetical protein
MKTLLYLGLTLATCRLFAQPTNPAWSHLPPDAAAIYHFNLAALTAKIPWYALAAPIPAPQSHTTNRELVSILRRPDNAGVDVRHDLFIIDQPDNGKTTSFLFELVDTARWTAFLRQQDPGLHLITLGGDTCFAGREKMGVAWDSRYAVLTFVRDLPHQPQPGETRKLAISRSLAILKGYDDSSCIREPLFRSGFADDADVHAWTRHGELLSNVMHLVLPPTHLHTLSSLRFEKGRIVLTSTICLPPGADSLYARLIDHPLSAHIAAHLPQTATLGLCSLHFNPALLTDWLSQLQTRGATEELLFDKGLSLESFAHGFQGDFILMASHSDAPHGQLPITLCFAASTLDPPAVTRWTSRLHPSNCTLRDSLLWIGRLPDSTALTADTALMPHLNDPSAPLSGYLDCKTLAIYWKRLPLLAIMDKLTFSAGRLNAAGHIENTFVLTLADPRAYSLQTLWPLLGP